MTASEKLEMLELRSRLSELARVVPWIDVLAARYAIPESSVFDIQLCLEEGISNIVRHGYADADGTIRVEFRYDGDALLFTIEDDAPHFQPSAAAAPAPASLEELKPGGLGIPLMRQFAKRVTWEPLAKGNRLTLEFTPSSK
jgi:anti-sigma regulatory factor (Ser/Thr protein kinase)